MKTAEELYDEDPANRPAGTVRQWPEDESQVPFEELADPILKIMAANYKWVDKKYEYGESMGERRRRPVYKDVVYNGYNIGRPELSGIGDPATNLSKASLWYHHDRDRDLMAVLVNIVFCLGVEQGRRDCAERRHYMLQKEAEYKALGKKWPPDPPTPEQREKAIKSIDELLNKKPPKPVTKKKKARKTNRK